MRFRSIRSLGNAGRDAQAGAAVSLAPEVMEAMKDAGASIDVIIAAVRADAALADKAVEERRAKDRERQRRHRESRNVTVTPRDSRDSPPNERDNLTPRKVTPPKPIGLDPKPKKHRLPVDWEPMPFKAGSMAALTVIRWEPGRMERELSKFRDHHTAAGSRFEDWQAAWSKWVNNSEDFQRGRNGGQQQSPGIGTTERAMQRALASIEGRAAGSGYSG